MLRSDLDQIIKAVRKIFRDEVKSEIRDSTRTLDHEIRASRMYLQKDIGALNGRVVNAEVRLKNVELRTSSIEQDFRSIHSDLTRKLTRMHKDIIKKLEIVSHTLDKQNVETLGRVKTLEAHLGLSEKN